MKTKRIKYLVTLYEHDWNEYNDEGLRRYIGRFLIIADETEGYAEIEEYALNMVNKERRASGDTPFEDHEVFCETISLKYVDKLVMRRRNK
jgi:hypothetical protein